MDCASVPPSYPALGDPSTWENGGQTRSGGSSTRPNRIRFTFHTAFAQRVGDPSSHAPRTTHNVLRTTHYFATNTNHSRFVNFANWIWSRCAVTVAWALRLPPPLGKRKP